MRFISALTCSIVSLSALIAPALAEDMQMKSGMMMMVSPEGKMTTTPADTSMSKEMMDKGTAMTEPMMMMIGPDGKMHMMKDEKMSNGKMMSDEMMKR